MVEIGEGVIRQTPGGKKVGLGLRGTVVDVSRKKVTIKTEAGSIIKFNKSEVTSLTKKGQSDAKKTTVSIKKKTRMQIPRKAKKLRGKSDINLLKKVSKATLGGTGSLKGFEKRIKGL